LVLCDTSCGMAKQLDRRPQRYEEIQGIGPKRAQRLRNELGPYTEFKRNSKNYMRNRLASVVSGSRRNLPKFAENVLRAQGTDREVKQVADNDLISTTSDGRTVKSKTVQKARNEEADRGGLGFQMMETDDNTFGAAFDVFQEEYDDEYDVPVRELGDTAREQVDNTDVTVQPIIGAVSSRVTFANNAQPEDLKNELESATENVDRATASPGELADGFVGFVSQQLGFGQEVGDFTVDRRGQKRAQEKQQERSMEARQVDNRRRAPITTDYDRWSSNPSGLDFPGVDTPTKTPDKRESDLPF